MIRAEPDGPITWITIDRPDKHNAFTLDGYADLRRALTEFDADAERRVAVVLGAGGRAFSTGSDMSGASWHPEDGRPVNVTEHPDVDLPGKPVIAAIDGYCLGGGLEWALRCDIRIATPASTFGLPEPRWGALAGYGLHHLPRMIGPGDALYLQLTGDRIDAHRALRLGIVQELVEPEGLRERAAEIAGMIVRCSPLAVAAIKQTVWFNVRQGIEDSYRFVAPLAETIGRSEDVREGPRAFIDKREPRWKGR
jgi:enoyl-CoA hydratase/carnithine racemase